VRGGDLLLGMVEGERFLEKKLGPDPRKKGPEGYKDHPGEHKFVLLTLSNWDGEYHWMKDDGNRYCHQHGGWFPHGDSVIIKEEKWAKDWPKQEREEDDD
jgi:hypothetical protein